MPLDDTIITPDPVASLSRLAPLRIGAVTLVVRDLHLVGDFYQQVLGLRVIDKGKSTLRLGAGSQVLLELREDPSARRRSPREAGLFHTAFLLPTRTDLANWLSHVARHRVPILGASDHLVSEAIYLADPEGNGIEVYADRAVEAWPRHGTSVDMPSLPLDLDALVGLGGEKPWREVPQGTFIGHVHLQVGNLEAAERFYAEILGFTLTQRVPGGSFYGSGGYHHHLGTNIWNSRGATTRIELSTGLETFELVIANQDVENALSERLHKAGIRMENRRVQDPFGTTLTIMPG